MQSDVWSFYDEASIYGKEVFAMGGGRGPSLAYYVPSLSAMQLFLPVHPEAARGHAAGHVYRLSDGLSAKVRYPEHWRELQCSMWESHWISRPPLARSNEAEVATYAQGVLLCSIRIGRVS